MPLLFLDEEAELVHTVDGVAKPVPRTHVGNCQQAERGGPYTSERHLSLIHDSMIAAAATLERV